MRERVGRLITVGSVLSWIFAAHVYSQTNEETLSGPDSHEKPLADRGYLFGDWAGLRSDLLKRGVSFDLQYVSDSLANVAGERDDVPSASERGPARPPDVARKIDMPPFRDAHAPTRPAQ